MIKGYSTSTQYPAFSISISQTRTISSTFLPCPYCTQHKGRLDLVWLRAPIWCTGRRPEEGDLNRGGRDDTATPWPSGYLHRCSHPYIPSRPPRWRDHCSTRHWWEGSARISAIFLLASHTHEACAAVWRVWTTDWSLNKNIWTTWDYGSVNSHTSMKPVFEKENKAIQAELHIRDQPYLAGCS